MKKIFIFTILSLLAYPNSDISILYLKNSCNSCHGMYGEGMGSAPRLQGVKEDILLSRLKELQKGRTRSPFGSVMISFAKSMDENQTKSMAKYLSTLTTTVAEDRYEIEYDNAGDGGS